MFKKTLAVFSLLILLTLSGCLQVSQQVWHNQDGSGKVVLEIIISEEMLSFMGYEGTAEENRAEILKEFEVSPDDLPTDDPNVRSAVVNSYYDPEAANFHVVMEIEVFDLLKGVSFEEDGEMNPFEFTITDNNDGSYRFSQFMDASSGMGGGELDQASLSMFETFMADDMYTLTLHMAELVEADPRAVYDQGKQTVKWEIPMVELMTLTEPVELWAVYRVESSSIFPSLNFSGLPRWVPLVVAGLCCLSLMAVVIFVVVVVLLARKRKKNMDQPESVEPDGPLA